MRHRGIFGHETGLGLVELMVALVVLTVAGLGLFYIGAVSTSGNTRSRNAATAMALAVDKMELLKNTPFGLVVSSPGTESIAADGSIGGEYARNWTVYPKTFSSNIPDVPAKNVTVSVSWPGGAPISVTTTIARIPISTDAHSTASVHSWMQTQ